MLRTRACAKVNLVLELHGKRDDGFHELHTLFDELDFGEELRFAPDDSSSFRLELVGEGAEGLPAGPENLVLRAASALRAAWGIDVGGSFTLHKRLPSGAGLGGGSADAAAALRLVARAVGRDGAGSGGASDAKLLDELEEIARPIGADVAFFVRGGRAVGLGRGDQMHAVSRVPELHYVLLLPDLHCDTGRVFRHVQARDARGRIAPGDAPGDDSEKAPIREPCHGDFDELELLAPDAALGSPSEDCRALLREPARSQTVLESSTGPAGELRGLFNDLTMPAFRAYPQLAALRAALFREGFTDLHLSGSGSTFFFATHSMENAARAAQSLEEVLARLCADGFEGLGTDPRVVCTRSRTAEV